MHPAAAARDFLGGEPTAQITNIFLGDAAETGLLPRKQQQFLAAFKLC